MLSSFILNNSPLKILRALYLSESGYSLRELSEVTALSIGAIQDNTKKLREAGLVKHQKKSNRIVFTLSLSKEDTHILELIFLAGEKENLRKRAEKVSTERLFSVLKVGDSLGKVKRKYGTT